MIRKAKPSAIKDDYATLKAVAQEYVKAEITCILSENKNKKEFINLLTVIELVPEEQEDSPPIGDQSLQIIFQRLVNIKG